MCVVHVVHMRVCKHLCILCACVCECARVCVCVCVCVCEFGQPCCSPACTLCSWHMTPRQQSVHFLESICVEEVERRRLVIWLCINKCACMSTVQTHFVS